MRVRVRVRVRPKGVEAACRDGLQGRLRPRMEIGSCRLPHPGTTPRWMERLVRPCLDLLTRPPSPLFFFFLHPLLRTPTHTHAHSYMHTYPQTHTATQTCSCDVRMHHVVCICVCVRAPLHVHTFRIPWHQWPFLFSPVLRCGGWGFACWTGRGGFSTKEYPTIQERRGGRSTRRQQ